MKKSLSEVHEVRVCTGQRVSVLVSCTGQRGSVLLSCTGQRVSVLVSCTGHRSVYWSHSQDAEDTHQWVPATEHTEPVQGRPQGLVGGAGGAESPGTEEEVAVVHWVIQICLRS